MLYLNGLKENLETLVILAKSSSPNKNMSSMAQVKSGLRDYLLAFQSRSIIPEINESEMIEIQNPSHLQLFRELFGERSRLNDLKQESLIDSDLTWNYGALNSDGFKEALNFIKSQDPGTYQYLNLIFNYYFFAASTKAAGGSSSGGIGILWVNPKPFWTLQDYCEFIIHEMTHQILFYDERRYGHYPNYVDIVKPENYAFSTILNRSRPLDKVIHSLFVGVNVLLFREKYFGLKSIPNLHPDSSKIIGSLEKTFESINQLPSNLLSPRIHHLLQIARNIIIKKPERSPA